ncbi:MAG: hypothetical protein NC827_07285 [Candidatus Omnitrophica bacterium]|nr:hypothetical protein [Candidatus Omnitrophota bacterium]
MKNKKMWMGISVISFLLGFGSGVYFSKISQLKNTIPRIKIEPPEYNLVYYINKVKKKIKQKRHGRNI